MILKKALSLIAAIAAMAAAAVVCVVAAAYALYALLRYYLGPAGASAVIAVGFAVLTLILAFVAFRKAKPKPTRREEQTLTTRLIDLAREKPIIAAGAAARQASCSSAIPRSSPPWSPPRWPAGLVTPSAATGVTGVAEDITSA